MHSGTLLRRPLAFLPSLRKAFVDYLHLSPDQTVVPENAQLLPAWGAALMAADERSMTAGSGTA